ncbi:MAG: hypothetical protein GC137_05700 [Alphaproteobacteria bacterium]|nr:hypothetical protein [Alphaproteobacteria bacterium]
MNFLKNTYLFSLTALTILLLSGSTLFAQNENDLTREERELLSSERAKLDWALHKSVTGAFEVKFARDYQYRVFPLQINQDTVIFSSEISADLKSSNPDIYNTKIIIKTVQTFGQFFAQEEIEEIFKNSVREYEITATEIGGKLTQDLEIKKDGFLGREIVISYQQDDKPYGMRIRVFLTDYSKVEQVLTGPAHVLYAYRAQDYFDSLFLKDGINRHPELEQAYGWKKYTSPNKIYSIKLPPENIDFTPKEPELSIRGASDFMTYYVTDPIHKQNVNLNIRSYVARGPLNFESIKTLILSNHISKYVQNASKDSLNLERYTEDGVVFMKAKVGVNAPKNMPYANTLSIHAMFKGNYAVVAEYLSTLNHSQTEFDEMLFSQIDFHPEKFSPAGIKKKPEQ